MYQEIQHSSGSNKSRMLFFLLINVKMPTIVGILTFMSRKKISCSIDMSMNFFFITSGPDLYDMLIRFHVIHPYA